MLWSLSGRILSILSILCILCILLVTFLRASCLCLHPSRWSGVGRQLLEGAPRWDGGCIVDRSHRSLLGGPPYPSLSLSR